MRIAFVVGELRTEQPHHTTVMLAYEAARRGHETWFIDVADFTAGDGHRLDALARRAPGSCASEVEFLAALLSEGRPPERVAAADLDVAMLRHCPLEDTALRPWVGMTALVIGRLLVEAGVLVINDPAGLERVQSKAYLLDLPADIRPHMLVTREPARVKDFAGQRGAIVVKPLQGRNGERVFVLRPETTANVNQMLEVVAGDGYILAQDYVAAAAGGTTRLFMMNGELVSHSGQHAALRLRPRGDDIRSNFAAGGTVEPALVDDACLRLAEGLRPWLLANGLFLVAVDTAGDRVLEVNAFCFGALRGAQRMTGTRFTGVIIDGVERALAGGPRAAAGAATTGPI